MHVASRRFPSLPLSRVGLFCLSFLVMTLCNGATASAQLGSLTITNPVANQSIVQQTSYIVTIERNFDIWEEGDFIWVELVRINSGNPPTIAGQVRQDVPQPPADPPNSRSVRKSHVAAG
jgi:hypothetical protein